LPYTPPTLAQCVEKSRQDFQANLPGSNAWLFPNNIAVSAKVFGGLIWSGYRFLAWILQQALASTASREYLYMHGAELGVAPLVATGSAGLVQVTGTVDLLIPTGTIVTRQDSLRMLTTADARIPPGGVVNAPVETEATGALTNTLDGTPLVMSLAGVFSTVSLGIVGGSDAESVEAYRQRVLYKKRHPPSVGSPSDYVRWCMDFPGVTRVFVTRANFGPGTVGIMFMMDATYSNGIPTPTDANNLKSYLEDIVPSDVFMRVEAPLPLPVPINIASLRPYTASVRQSITDELQGMFQRRSVVDPLNTTSFSKSWIGEAVSRATGEDSHTLVSPASDVVVRPGQIPVVGSIVYTP
jgi:uncharacterized phage protein gp47/JayE